MAEDRIPWMPLWGPGSSTDMRQFEQEAERQNRELAATHHSNWPPSGYENYCYPNRSAQAREQLETFDKAFDQKDPRHWHISNPGPRQRADDFRVQGSRKSTKVQKKKLTKRPSASQNSRTRAPFSAGQEKRIIQWRLQNYILQHPGRNDRDLLEKLLGQLHGRPVDIAPSTWNTWRSILRKCGNNPWVDKLLLNYRVSFLGQELQSSDGIDHGCLRCNELHDLCLICQEPNFNSWFQSTRSHYEIYQKLHDVSYPSSRRLYRQPGRYCEVIRSWHIPEALLPLPPSLEVAISRSNVFAFSGHFSIDSETTSLLTSLISTPTPSLTSSLTLSSTPSEEHELFVYSVLPQEVDSLFMMASMQEPSLKRTSRGSIVLIHPIFAEWLSSFRRQIISNLLKLDSVIDWWTRINPKNRLASVATMAGEETQGPASVQATGLLQVFNIMSFAISRETPQRVMPRYGRDPEAARLHLESWLKDLSDNKAMSNNLGGFIINESGETPSSDDEFVNDRVVDGPVMGVLEDSYLFEDFLARSPDELGHYPETKKRAENDTSHRLIDPSLAVKERSLNGNGTEDMCKHIPSSSSTSPHDQRFDQGQEYQRQGNAETNMHHTNGSLISPNTIAVNGEERVKLSIPDKTLSVSSHRNAKVNQGKQRRIDTTSEIDQILADITTPRWWEKLLIRSLQKPSQPFVDDIESRSGQLSRCEVALTKFYQGYDAILELARPRVAVEVCRISWTCRCGRRLYLESPKSRQKAALEFVHEAAGSANASSVTIESSGGEDSSSTASDTTQDSVGANSSIRLDGLSPRSSSTLSSVSNEQQDYRIADYIKKYMLLCVNTGTGLIKLKNVDITKEANEADSEGAFKRLREGYSSLRGLNRHNPFVKAKTMEYVRFQLLNFTRSRECVGDLKINSVPSCEETKLFKYAFSPCPPLTIGGLPLPQHVFMHSFLNPGDHLGPRVVDMLPKKLETELKWGDDAEIGDVFNFPQGWGFYIKEDWDWPLIAWFVFIAVVAFSLTAVLWSVVMGDVQGGVGIGQYCMAVLAVSMSVVILLGREATAICE